MTDEIEKKKKKKRLECVCKGSQGKQGSQGKKDVFVEVDDKLRNIFKRCIGKENIIFMDELFFEIFKTNMDEEPFRRYFWKDFVIRRMRKLRREGKCFICCQQQGYFVLKSQDEADYYKDILRRDIMAMKGSMIKADEWVEEEKWRGI